VPICFKCHLGFDLVEGAPAVCPRCGTRWAPLSTDAERLDLEPWLGNFFLSVGILVCSLGCVFAVVKTIYGLLAFEQVASIIRVPGTSYALFVVLTLLDGFVCFSLCAALVVVFFRALR
jgi:hypothetical protein